MTRRIVLAILVALAAIAHTPPCLAGSTESDLIEQIRQAWKKRESACRSFVAEWTQETTYPTGSLFYGNDGKPFPPNDKVTPLKFRFLCDGNRVKFTRRGLEYDLNRSDLLDTSFTRAFDGATRREVYESEEWGAHPGGFLKENSEFDEPDGEWRVHALIATFRPASPQMGAVNLSSATLKPGMAMISGVKCHVLDVPRHAASADRFYVATSPDFRLMRREITSRTLPVRQLTIDYEPHASLGFVCKSWTLVDRLRADRSITEIDVVPKITLTVNDRVDPAELAFKFAPGTVVSNKGTGAVGVVRRDGSIRTATMGERASGSTWDQLMESDPLPEALPIERSGTSAMTYLVWGGVLIGAVLFTWVVARNTAKSSSRTSHN